MLCFCTSNSGPCHGQPQEWKTTRPRMDGGKCRLEGWGWATANPGRREAGTLNHTHVGVGQCAGGNPQHAADRIGNSNAARNIQCKKKAKHGKNKKTKIYKQKISNCKLLAIKKTSEVHSEHGVYTFLLLRNFHFGVRQTTFFRLRYFACIEKSCTYTNTLKHEQK